MSNLKTKKRKKRIIILSILVVVVAVGLAGALRKKDTAIAVQKEKVTRRNLTELVVASGKIQPVTQVKLSPEVSGEIIELPFREGQAVKKGDLLVKIKPDPYLASKNSSEANYNYSLAAKNTAEANLEKADAEYKWQEELAANKIISKSDRQAAKTAYDVAKATLAGAAEQVGMAKAQLDRAKDDLSKTTIYSPITGTVTKLYSQVGERVVGTATMAGTDIMIVSDLNEMETRVDIGEVDVVHIAIGQNARLEVDAFKDQKFKGMVTEIANSSKNSDVGTSAAAAAASSSSSQEATKFQVKIRILEKEAFRPGMSVTAEIETRSRTNVLTVPIQSVTMRAPKAPAMGAGTNNPVVVASKDPTPGIVTNGSGPKKFGDFMKQMMVVFIVENGRAKMMPIKQGIQDDNYVEITEGLSEGQEVVSGNSKAIKELQDDKPVMNETVKAGWPGADR